MTESNEQPLLSVADRYLLVEALSSDAGHVIWRGHDDLAGRQVVVTRYLGTGDEWREIFGRRARRLERLSDPGIASVLAHDASDDPPWLVTAYVDGESAARIRADRGLMPDDALAVLGQTALALAAAHGVGVGHGRLDDNRILVRPDGSVALIGFVVDTDPEPKNDLRALTRLAHQLLDGAAGEVPDISSFLQLLDAGDWDDPGDIGRTALALAEAQRIGQTFEPAAAPATDEDDETAVEPSRPWYDEDERKRVRNALIALGAIVVVGGVALLRIFNAGAGQTAVPSVVGVPYVQALHELNEVGLRGNETITTGPVGTEGTVIAQDPVGGQRAKVGSVVDLTVAAAGS